MRRYLCLVALLAAALVAFVPGSAAWAADPASPAPEVTPAVGEVCEPADRPFDPEGIHLTGAWDDGDGGIWYLRQVGSRVYLTAMSDRMSPPGSLGRGWTTVATGTLGDDLSITLDFAQVPRGNMLDVGTLTMNVVDSGSGSIRLMLPDWGMTLQPCVPATRVASDFVRPFEYRDDIGIGLMYFSGPEWGLNPSVVAIHPGHAEDMWGTGLSVWRINEDSAVSCETGPGPKLEPGPAAFLDWLRTRTDLVVGEGSEVTVDGRPATSVDVTASPSAKVCFYGQLRLSQTDGAPMMLPSLDATTRLIALDLDGDTIVFELWGPDQEEWLPLAQRVLDTIHFVG